MPLGSKRYFHLHEAEIQQLLVCDNSDSEDALVLDEEDRDVAAAPQTPNWGGPRPTLGAQVSLKLLFGYAIIFSSADLFTTDLNCRKKLACDIISECYIRHFISQNLEYFD